MQLLVFHTDTGKVLLDSKLEGLPKALGAASEAPFVTIWGIGFF